MIDHPPLAPSQSSDTSFFSSNDPAVVALAEQHLRDVLLFAFKHTNAHAAVVVYDRQCELSLMLTAAYRRCLPEAHFIDFDASSSAQVLAILAPLLAGDLVVLIQSTNFRMDAFRIRVELFKRELKVIEHPHLARMQIGRAHV